MLPLGIHCITHTHKHTHTHTNTCLMLNLKCVFGHSLSVILFSRGAPLPAIKSNYFGHKTVLFFNLASGQNFALFSFPCRHSCCSSFCLTLSCLVSAFVFALPFICCICFWESVDFTPECVPLFWLWGVDSLSEWTLARGQTANSCADVWQVM